MTYRGTPVWHYLLGGTAMYVALCDSTILIQHEATMYQRHEAIVKELVRRRQRVFAGTLGLAARALAAKMAAKPAPKIITLDRSLITPDMLE